MIHLIRYIQTSDWICFDGDSVYAQPLNSNRIYPEYTEQGNKKQKHKIENRNDEIEMRKKNYACTLLQIIYGRKLKVYPVNVNNKYFDCCLILWNCK